MPRQPTPPTHDARTVQVVAPLNRSQRILVERRARIAQLDASTWARAILAEKSGYHPTTPDDTNPPNTRLYIRVTPELAEAITAAAEGKGLLPGDWACMILIEETGWTPKHKDEFPDPAPKKRGRKAKL